VELKSHARIQARTSDLSLGGCYVDTTSPFPTDTTVKVRLVKENQSLQAEGKVVYSLSGMGMGIMFTNVDAEQRKVLDRWIGELSGELVPELSTRESAEPRQVTKGSSNQQSYVLSELVIELMRQGVLSNEKGKAMLAQLLN
jgi:hypothetical protein